MRVLRIDMPILDILKQSMAVVLHFGGVHSNFIQEQHAPKVCVFQNARRNGGDIDFGIVWRRLLGYNN